MILIIEKSFIDGNYSDRRKVTRSILLMYLNWHMQFMFQHEILLFQLTRGLWDAVNFPIFERIVSPSRLISFFESNSVIVKFVLSIIDFNVFTFNDWLKSVGENCRFDILSTSFVWQTQHFETSVKLITKRLLHETVRTQEFLLIISNRWRACFLIGSIQTAEI